MTFVCVTHFFIQTSCSVEVVEMVGTHNQVQLIHSNHLLVCLQLWWVEEQPGVWTCLQSLSFWYSFSCIKSMEASRSFFNSSLTTRPRVISWNTSLTESWWGQEKHLSMFSFTLWSLIQTYFNLLVPHGSGISWTSLCWFCFPDQSWLQMFGFRVCWSLWRSVTVTD